MVEHLLMVQWVAGSILHSGPTEILLNQADSARKYYVYRYRLGKKICCLMITEYDFKHEFY